MIIPVNLFVSVSHLTGLVIMSVVEFPCGGQALWEESCLSGQFPSFVARKEGHLNEVTVPS
jgi:hypothetical protein